MWYPVDQGVTRIFAQGTSRLMDAFKGLVVIVINA